MLANSQVSLEGLSSQTTFDLALQTVQLREQAWPVQGVVNVCKAPDFPVNNKMDGCRRPFLLNLSLSTR